MSNYGTLGRDVGDVGWWLRLLWGLLLLGPAVFEAEPSIRFIGLSLLLLILIAAAYLVGYRLLGRRLLATGSPWVNTAVLVGPGLLLLWWNVIIAPWTGLELPGALPFAIGLYIGLSFLIQWGVRYGGCEVIALPILIWGQRYVSYCIPLVAVDAVEKRMVDASTRRAKILWTILLLIVLLILVAYALLSL